MTARSSGLGHSKNHLKHYATNKVRLVILFFLVSFVCFAEQANAHSTRIDIRKAEVASNGMVALETNYGINDMQIRLLDPIQKRIFARIKIDNVEDGSYFSNLLADDNRFVFQLKNKSNYSGIYTVDSSVDVKKLGSVNHKLQLATKNWFLFTKDDEDLTPVRYDKKLKEAIQGHIPGHPELIALNGQRDHEGIWLACIKITEPLERYTSTKAKLFLVYLADDDKSSVYPIGTVDEIGHKIHVSVGDKEVWLSKGWLPSQRLHVFEKEKKEFRHYSGSYRSIANPGYDPSNVLMANSFKIINVEGNNGKPLFARPKINHDITPLTSSSNRVVHEPKPKINHDITPLISSSNKVVHEPKPRREVFLIGPSQRVMYKPKTGEEIVIYDPTEGSTVNESMASSKAPPKRESEVNIQEKVKGATSNREKPPLSSPRSPLLPEDEYELVNIDFLEKKLGVPYVEPLFTYKDTLWCKANKDGDQYWVRLDLGGKNDPEVVQMKMTLSEKLIAGATQVGEIIVGTIFIFTGPM